MSTLTKAAECERLEALKCQREGRKAAREGNVRANAYKALNGEYRLEFCSMVVTRIRGGVQIKVDGRLVFKSERKSIKAYVPGDWTAALEDLAMSRPTKAAFSC